MVEIAQPRDGAHPMKPRILIADDFEALRRGLKAILGTAICGEAENGQQAVEKVLELCPDLVILDWTMPVMGGGEAARSIRTLAPQTKIIVFSLHDERAVRDEALRVGAHAFLHKTAGAEEIVATVRALLDGFPDGDGQMAGISTLTATTERRSEKSAR
jgi:DNA-binding NarL/FixJ family response regulator